MLLEFTEMSYLMYSNVTKVQQLISNYFVILSGTKQIYSEISSHCPACCVPLRITDVTAPASAFLCVFEISPGLYRVPQILPPTWPPNHHHPPLDSHGPLHSQRPSHCGFSLFFHLFSPLDIRHLAIAFLLVIKSCFHIFTVTGSLSFNYYHSRETLIPFEIFIFYKVLITT